MRRIPAVLLILTLLAGATPPARASESPLRSPSIEVARVFEGLWNLFLSLFSGDNVVAGNVGTTSPNGATAPQGDLGSDMDPNG